MPSSKTTATGTAPKVIAAKRPAAFCNHLNVCIIGVSCMMEIFWRRHTTMSNEGYHEPINELSDETRDFHRAVVSLMEELEAVDWYNQRVDACKDAELKAILEHNRDEEKEHAAMVLEWIRRRDARFDKELKEYLFTEAPITQLEES